MLACPHYKSSWITACIVHAELKQFKCINLGILVYLNTSNTNRHGPYLNTLFYDDKIYVRRNACAIINPAKDGYDSFQKSSTDEKLRHKYTAFTLKCLNTAKSTPHKTFNAYSLNRLVEHGVVISPPGIYTGPVCN